MPLEASFLPFRTIIFSSLFSWENLLEEEEVEEPLTTFAQLNTGEQVNNLWNTFKHR